MTVFRYTQKLAKKFGIALVETDVVPTNILGDWFFNHLILGRKHFVIGISGRTFLPVIVGAAESRSFPDRFVQRLGETLILIGVPPESAEFELAQMSPQVDATTNSRVALGVLNDMIFMSSFGKTPTTKEEEIEISLYLGKIIFKPLAYNSPIKATLDLFSRGNVNI